MELLNKVAQKLEENNMRAFVVNSSDEVYKIVKSLIPEGSVVSFGGSETIKETQILEKLEEDGYALLDRRKEGADVNQIYRDTFSADFYLCSSNAITEDGALFNVDGNANRVSALTFGPKNVIVIAGKNKIVEDLNQASLRVKNYVAPKNCKRLGLDTYCAREGKCVSLTKENPSMYDGCASDSRICCSYVVSAKQRIKNRINVILVNESLGY